MTGAQIGLSSISNDVTISFSLSPSRLLHYTIATVYAIAKKRRNYSVVRGTWLNLTPVIFFGGLGSATCQVLTDRIRLPIFFGAVYFLFLSFRRVLWQWRPLSHGCIHLWDHFFITSPDDTNSLRDSKRFFLLLLLLCCFFYLLLLINFVFVVWNINGTIVR